MRAIGMVNYSTINRVSYVDRNGVHAIKPGWYNDMPGCTLTDFDRRNRQLTAFVPFTSQTIPIILPFQHIWILATTYRALCRDVAESNAIFRDGFVVLCCKLGSVVRRSVVLE